VLLGLTFDGGTQAAYELLSELTSGPEPTPVVALTVRDSLHDRGRGGPKRGDHPVSLGLLDLYRFKSINDCHGHAAGDAVLRRLGELLMQTFRGEDVVGRWGGEEFVVGMYASPRDDGIERLRGVLDTFGAERFNGARGERFAVTFSCGVAVYPGDGEDAAALQRTADAALYRAKAAGRASVVGT
jgi:diguanylate cyclase (GGDEF)-like protein